MKKQSRRSFLRSLVFKGDQRSGGPGHVLVCVFLRGGADTLNMIIPYGDDDYFKARPTLGIRTARRGEKADSDLARPVTDFYSFHPRMEPLIEPFKIGRLLIVQSVGSDNVSGSHFEAQDQMEHGESASARLTGGWLGRHLFCQENSRSSPFAAVSIGAAIPESLRGAPGATAINTMEEIRLDTGEARSESVRSGLAALYGAAPAPLGQAGIETLALLSKVETLGRSGYELSKPSREVSYPDSQIGRRLREVARIARAGIGLEIACVDMDNWDTHFFQGAADGQQASLISELSQALSAFDRDTEGIPGGVTTLVLTEFGRRTYENSSMGTDHGRGFALMALGDRIAGGRILGSWKGLKNMKGMDETALPVIGPGGLAVETDYRQVLAEVVRELLGNRRLDKVFPGLVYRPVGITC
ncbi:MAG: DUF1501 domain-containing protein [Candidatus Melainabacteria bacterium]|nr:DUF1501 domain-containing protein [Candidatus Melainabacteria bacterium]